MFIRLLIVICLLLAACTIPNLEQRTRPVADAARIAGWQSQQIETTDFTLQSWYSPIKANSDLVVYIEGDGLAWINSRRPSSNPTPINSLAFKLAMQHPEGNVVYLARPCQFISIDSQPNCKRDAWTDGRFSESVVKSMDSAITKLKDQFTADRITLVGFSGGGAIAILVAASRGDVEKIITLAGNLDHRAWTDYHKLQPLSHSLNPADFAKQVSSITQLHLVGAVDEVIPSIIAASYLSRFADRQNIKIEIVEGYDHHCCWENGWSDMIKKVK